MIRAMKQFLIFTIFAFGFNAVVLSAIHANQNKAIETQMVKYAQR